MYMKMSLNVSSPPVSGHVAAAGGQLEHGEVDGAERAGAGGVDDAVGAAQVEAVGDPAGGDVAEQAGERVLLPADVRVGDPLDDVFGGGVGRRRRLQRPAPDRVAEPGAERDDQFQRAGDAEDHARRGRGRAGADPAP